VIEFKRNEEDCLLSLLNEKALFFSLMQKENVKDKQIKCFSYGMKTICDMMEYFSNQWLNKSLHFHCFLNVDQHTASLAFHF
jgi:hypothetical protein